MSQPSGPRPDMRGAVDLSGLGRAKTPPPGGTTAGAVVDIVDEATFRGVVEQSLQVPVVLVLWAAWSEASAQVTKDLAARAEQLGGRVLLARIDADLHPDLAQALGAQAVPAVLGVLRGQLVPLFQGPADAAGIAQVLDQFLQVAAANQVTGSVAVASAEPQAPAEPDLPPLHAEARAAVSQGDFAAAAAAFGRALALNPRDAEAERGLAHVELLARVEGFDPDDIDERAQDETDVSAQLDRADLDFAGGLVAEAFARLLAVVRRTAGADRDAARSRLVALLGIMGDADPRVARARRDLASALY